MPTATFSIASSADDQLLFNDTSTGYNVTGTLSRSTNDLGMYAARSQYGPSTFRVLVGLMRWDTSSIPDGATITGATLRLYYYATGANTNALSNTGDWYVFDGTDANDYSHAALTTAFSGFDASAGGFGSYDIALSNAATNVSTSGYTGIRMHMSQRAADAAPTGANEWYFSSWDHATNPEPQLIVAYYDPGDGPGNAYIQIGP